MSACIGGCSHEECGKVVCWDAELPDTEDTVSWNILVAFTRVLST
jgi:hypothetical protein